MQNKVNFLLKLSKFTKKKIFNLDMGKRYFCDFCQKSIPSDWQNRCKHNQSVAHLTKRAQYYSPHKGLFQFFTY